MEQTELDALIARALETARAVNVDMAAQVTKAAEVYQTLAPKPKSGSSGGNGRARTKGREFGTDIALTEGLVYQIMVPSQKAVYFCVGLGTTERMAWSLRQCGHPPVVFKTTYSGTMLPKPLPYRVLLSHGSKTAHRFVRSPQYDKWHLVEGEATLMDLIKVSNLPSGGVEISVVPVDERPKPDKEDTTSHINCYLDQVADVREFEHLREVEAAGGSTLTAIKDVPALVTAFEIFMDTEMSVEAKKLVIKELLARARGQQKPTGTGIKPQRVSDDPSFYRALLVAKVNARTEYDYQWHLDGLNTRDW